MTTAEVPFNKYNDGDDVTTVRVIREMYEKLKNEN